jgi:hypothetical protein
MPVAAASTGISTGRLGGRPTARRLLQPLPAGLGKAQRVKAAGNDEPIPFNRVGDAGRIRRKRAQVAQGLPSLRLAAGRLMEFAHDAKRRLFERANFWRASSALRCCFLWHRGYQGRGATHSWDELKAASIKGEVAGDVPCEEWGQERANFGTLSALDRQQPRHLALRCRSRAVVSVAARMRGFGTEIRHARAY